MKSLGGEERVTVKSAQAGSCSDEEMGNELGFIRIRKERGDEAQVGSEGSPLDFARCRG